MREKSRIAEMAYQLLMALVALDLCSSFHTSAVHCRTAIGMRLDFGHAEDWEEDLRVARERANSQAALDAAIEAEDYVEAQQIKLRMDSAAEADVIRKDAAWASTAAAAFTTPDETPPVAAGFRYDTSSSTRRSLRSSNAMSDQIRVDDEWTDEVSDLVQAQMRSAFDNYQPDEVDSLLSALVQASSQQNSEAERALRSLAGLARQMEALEAAARRGAGAVEYLEDEASALRSQIRMWGREGEKHQPRKPLGWTAWWSKE